MCLSYKISGFVLVAVMITRIQCGTGDDCATLTQCMVDSGITFQSVFNPEDAGIVRNLFDIVCSNMDTLVNCYKPLNLQGCHALQYVFQLQPNADNMRDQFTKACAQKEGMIETIECIAKDGVVESMNQCASSVLDTQSNIQENRTVSCSEFSEVLKCIEKSGHCSANAVLFLGSIYQEQLNITCPVSKTAVNGFGYCKQETYKVIFLLWLLVCFSI